MPDKGSFRIPFELRAELRKFLLPRPVEYSTIAYYLAPQLQAGSRANASPIIASLPNRFDTNVLVAGAHRHEASPAYQVLLAILHRQVPWMLIEGTSAAYEDVLWPLQPSTLTGLTPRQNGDLILNLVALSRQPQLHFLGVRM